MSSSHWESRARQLRRELERKVKTRADEEGKAARADQAAMRAEESARRASSQSTASSKLRDAERKRKEAQKAREKAAAASKATGDLQTKIHDAEQKATRDRAQEQASEERRNASRAKQEERRNASRAKQDERRAKWQEQQRIQAEQAREAAREREVLELKERTAELEAAIREARGAAPAEITVLFLAGPPQLDDEAPLRLDQEVREIQERLRASEHRDAIRIEYRLATRVADILQALNEVAPDVVHFSGHGGQQALVFEGSDGEPRPLSNKDLALLLQAAPTPIRLAIFNSCESSTQAALACDFVDAAIGMEEPVDDEAAKEFAGQLYSSLGFGQDLGLAFEQAKTQAAVVSGQDEQVPRLFTAADVEAEEIVLVRPAESEAA